MHSAEDRSSNNQVSWWGKFKCRTWLLSKTVGAIFSGSFPVILSFTVEHHASFVIPSYDQISSLGRSFLILCIFQINTWSIEKAKTDLSADFTHACRCAEWVLSLLQDWGETHRTCHMMLALAFCNTLHRTLTDLLTVRDIPDELGSRVVRCLEIDGLEENTDDHVSTSRFTDSQCLQDEDSDHGSQGTLVLGWGREMRKVVQRYM